MLLRPFGSDLFCPLISKDKIDEILEFRKARLGQSEAKIQDLNYKDFDILLHDFFEYCAGNINLS